jgi:type I restriction enzyme S subunit
MNEWKEIQLRNISSDISYGYTASAASENVGPKFLRITDITSGRINWETVPYCKISDKDFIKYRLGIGDIVIARTGATTGYNAIIKKDVNAVYASYLIRFQIDKKQADPFFVGHILQSNNFQDYVDAIAGGSAQPGANAQQFADFEFLLPPLPEQTAIAEVLNSLDDKIDLLYRQNKTLEQLAETLFRQWFVEEAEEGWEEMIIRDIADHYKESINPSKSPDIIFHHFSLPAFDEGKNPKAEIGKCILSNKYKVVPNSILVSKLNPRFPRIWELYGNDVPENAICSTEFQIIKPKDSSLFGLIYCFLKSNQVTQELANAAGGTSGSHQRVNPDDIFNLSFPMPPKELVEEFDSLTKEYFQKMKSNTQQIRTLNQIRDTLLPKMMSGEVRMKIN